MASPVTDERTLVFAPGLRRRLVGWGKQAAPREACGLLIGTVGRTEDAGAQRLRGARPAMTGASGGVRVRAVTHSENLSDSEARFELNPVDWVRGERAATVLGLRVIGFWHSHPRGPAVPSEHDWRGAPEGFLTAVVALDSESPRASVRVFRRTPEGFQELRFQDEAGRHGEPRLTSSTARAGVDDGCEPAHSIGPAGPTAHRFESRNYPWMFS